MLISVASGNYSIGALTVVRTLNILQLPVTRATTIAGSALLTEGLLLQPTIYDDYYYYDNCFYFGGCLSRVSFWSVS